MEEALIEEGFNNVIFNSNSRGNHNEATWAGDFANAYLWLFEDYSVTSINEVPSDLQLQLYPNPVKDVVNIRLSDRAAVSSIKIYSMGGQQVKASNSADKSIDVGG
ncbi:MAG: T9SS type A sorting domain-containing protein [Bacteroidales bacterium]|nr:T9SS type A sorting domain-containing protein [Bacteroidales bacterium]